MIPGKQNQFAIDAGRQAILQIPADALRDYLNKDREVTFDEGFRLGLCYSQLAASYSEPPLTFKEAAAALGVSVSTITRLRDEGDLESFEVGGQVRFEASEIERYKRTHRSLAVGIKQLKEAIKN